jgi:hypothetical protein
MASPSGSLYKIIKDFCTAKSLKITMEDTAQGAIVLLVQQECGVTLVLLHADEKQAEVLIDCTYLEDIDQKFRESGFSH